MISFCLHVLSWTPQSNLHFVTMKIFLCFCIHGGAMLILMMNHV